MLNNLYICCVKIFRKIIASVLLLLFATETFGVYRYVHFCGGDPTSESYFIQKKDCCCDAAAEEAEMDDCCKDEIKIAQIDSNITAPVSNHVNSPKAISIAIFYLLSAETVFNTSSTTCFFKVQENYQFYDSSPPIRHLVCSYLI